MVLTIIFLVGIIIFTAAFVDAIKDGRNPRPYRNKGEVWMRK